MHSIAQDALVRQPRIQPNRIEHIRRFRLPIRHIPIISILGGLCKHGRQRRRMHFLGWDLALLKIIIRETNRTESVAQTREIDHARRARRVGFGRSKQLRRERVGEEEVADVVCAELAFDAFFGPLPLLRHEACVVDDQVQAVG